LSRDRVLPQELRFKCKLSGVNRKSGGVTEVKDQTKFGCKNLREKGKKNKGKKKLPRDNLLLDFDLWDTVLSGTIAFPDGIRDTRVPRWRVVIQYTSQVRPFLVVEGGDHGKELGKGL